MQRRRRQLGFDHNRPQCHQCVERAECGITADNVRRDDLHRFTYDLVNGDTFDDHDSPGATALAAGDRSHRGQIITTPVYTFRGATVPGAGVAVGRNYADVEDTGEWRLDLIVPPGSSATTVISTDPTSQPSTTVRVQLRYEPDLDLTVGGIDGAWCGTPYEEAMQALTDLLGEPPQIDTYPPIGAYRQRGSVNAEWSWSEGGFLAMFAEWSLCVMGETDEYLHFMGWEIEGDSAGLRLGCHRTGGNG